MEKNKEYEQLYNEIGRNSQISSNLFLANITGTTAIIGFGLDNWGSNNSSWLFLAPFALLIPSLLFIASQMESTTCIASYIKNFHEETSSDLKWETRWYQMRSGFLPNRKYKLSISGLYGLIGIICIILSFKSWPKAPYWNLIFVTIPIFVMFLLSILSVIRAFSLGLVKKYDDDWEEIKQSEKNNSTENAV